MGTALWTFGPGWPFQVDVKADSLYGCRGLGMLAGLFASDILSKHD